MSLDGQNFACADVKRLLQLTDLSELVKRVEINRLNKKKRLTL